MKKSKHILTLCNHCANDYFNSPQFYIKPVYPRGDKENCTKCNRKGYDYEVVSKSERGKHDE